jgi:hypothetical protein
MTPRPKRGWFPRATAVLVTTAIVLSAFAPGTAALAAEVHVGRAADPMDGAAGVVQPVALTAAPLTPALALAPALTAPAAPPASAPGELGGHARPLAAVPVPSLRPAPAAAPALAAAPAAASSPLSRLGSWLSRAAAGLKAARPASGGAANASAPEPGAAPAANETGDEAKTRADAEFRRLTGETAPERGELTGGPAPVAAGAAAAPAPSGLSAADAPLPKAWGRFPAEARESSPEALLAAKADAQRRARKIARDARLVRVAVNLGTRAPTGSSSSAPTPATAS